MAITSGEVFAIKTSLGFGFLQFIEKSPHQIHRIRVLEPIRQDIHISQEEVDLPERFTIGFPLSVAHHRKIVERVGQFTIPKKYVMPTKGRSKHNIGDRFLGWFIVDLSTLQRKLKKKLSASELKLSPEGVWNDTLIIERLEKDWRLENWK